MKPIEKGCIAITVGLPTTGVIEVTVGKFLGKVQHFVGEDRWEVDKPITGRDRLTKVICGRYLHCRAKNLLRIDGYKEEETEKLEAVV